MPQGQPVLAVDKTLTCFFTELVLPIDFGGVNGKSQSSTRVCRYLTLLTATASEKLPELGTQVSLSEFDVASGLWSERVAASAPLVGAYGSAASADGNTVSREVSSLFARAHSH